MNTGCQLVEAAAAERGGLRGLGPEGGRAAAQPAFRRCSGNYTHTTKTQKHPPPLSCVSWGNEDLLVEENTSRSRY